MSTVARVLDVARSQIGVVERPINRVMYNDWAGVVPGAWCGTFVSWCLDQAGALDVPIFPFTPNGAAYYQKAGRWGSVPRLGAVVFFAWPSMGRICHTALVAVLRSDGRIGTIEGNTDEEGGRTGGKVMEHIRGSCISGYGYPKYSAIQSPEVMKVNPDFDPPLHCVSFKANPHGPGVWGLGPDGGIFALEGAPFRREDGGPGGSAAGKDYFRGRVAAKLHLSPEGLPVIEATTGERYGPDF
jgi:hypothetical protein